MEVQRLRTATKSARNQLCSGSCTRTAVLVRCQANFIGTYLVPAEYFVFIVSAPNENTLPHPFLDDNGINPVYQKDLVRDFHAGFLNI